MKTSAKVIVTIILVIVFFALFAVVVGVRSDAGDTTPGILGLILFGGLIGGLSAIWKKKKK